MTFLTHTQMHTPTDTAGSRRRQALGSAPWARGEALALVARGWDDPRTASLRAPVPGHGASLREHSRSAFSLVEVLIAVFVMSLGMLGLASIFPVVLREQRAAGDTTEGAIALGSVESVLRSNLELSRRGDKVGWGILQDDDNQNNGWSKDGEWQTPEVVGGNEPNGNSRLSVDGQTGLLRFHSDQPTGNARDPFGNDILIPQSARLGPGAFLRGANPRVDWILAARRVITKVDINGEPLPTDTDEIEVVVFVRPIDRAIQVPRRDRTNKADWAQFGRTINLSDVILQREIVWNNQQRAGATTNEARVAVGVRPQDMQPTNDGRGNYAAPFTFELQTYDFDETDPGQSGQPPKLLRDRLQVDLPANSPILRVISQPGQRIVDARGTVYRVRGRLQQDPRVILIDPPVASYIESSEDLSRMVASPVVPVSVEVFRVRP